MFQRHPKALVEIFRNPPFAEIRISVAEYKKALKVQPLSESGLSDKPSPEGSYLNPERYTLESTYRLSQAGPSLNHWALRLWLAWQGRLGFGKDYGDSGNLDGGTILSKRDPLMSSGAFGFGSWVSALVPASACGV